VSTITHIQFCPADWLSGCHTLTAAERGVYITLIMMMYDRAGPLTEDEGRLARACGLPTVGFSRALNALVDQGKIQRIEGGLFNARVGREIENVMAKSQIARANVEARWAKKPMKSKEFAYGGNTDVMLTNNHKPVASSLRSDDAPKRKRGSRIADNWKPDTEAAREIGLTESEVRQEARKFVDYWIAAPNGVKLDWDATWRNWCRRVVETRGRSRGPPSNGLTGFAAVHEHLRQRNADTLGSENRADAGGYGSGSAPLLERGHDDGGWFSDRGRE